MGENLMPVVRTYECPDCQHQFRHMHMTKDEPAPDYCPACGNYMGDEPVALPSLFSLKSTKTKNADATYRAVERGSEIRAEIAAEQHGFDKADMASLRITDMKDYLKPGEVAAKMPPNPISDMMAKQKSNPNVGFVSPQAGAQYGVGRVGRVGEHVMKNICTTHYQNIPMVQKGGELKQIRRGARKAG